MVAVGVLRSCDKKKPTIAELSEILGGQANKSIDGSAWSPAFAGDEFREGDGIRTSAKGSARLRFSEKAILRLGNSTTLLLGPKLRLSGEVQNESAGAMTLELVGRNRVKLEPGAKISLSKAGGEGLIVVLVGSAVVTTEEGDQTLGEGDSFQISLGPVTIEEIEDDAGPADAGPIDAVPIDAAVDAARAATVRVIAKGRGVRVKESADAKERKLSAGSHELPAGAQVSIRRRSSVSFQRGAEQVDVRGKATATIGSPGDPVVRVGRGRAEVIGKDTATTIAVPGGKVTARAARGRGSLIEVVVGRDSRITPKNGRADVSSARARETIQIGERIEMSKDGVVVVFGRQPKVADFSIRAGESASIHDPGAPTALRMRFDCDDGLLEWSGRAKQRVRGPGSAITSLPSGSYRYTVRCYVDGNLQSSGASGRIRVDRKSGTKPLPSKPPHNIIDATGENYEVFYQNLLPHVTIRWPNAKAGGRYKLHLKRSAAAAKVYTTSGPSYRVKNLKEGSYRFWFEGDGTRSKEGLVTLKFDNAASSGYIRRPRVGGSWGGSQVAVEGAGIRGTRASVGGVSLPTDGQNRFDVTVEKPSAEAAIAIRISTPGQGTHYYVRRNGRR